MLHRLLVTPPVKKLIYAQHRLCMYVILMETLWCGTHAVKLNSYPGDCCNYMMVKKQFTIKRHVLYWWNRSSKSIKQRQLMLLVSVPQLCLKVSVSLCLQPLSHCVHPPSAPLSMTGQLILTLFPSAMMTAQAAGSCSLALHVPVCLCACVCVCAHAPLCWLPGWKSLA